MAEKTKNVITKDSVPEGFSVPLALVDAIPVAVFAIAFIVLGKKAKASFLIPLGGLIAFIGGAIKVAWKIIVAVKKKNIWWMFVQMRYTMPLGFVLILIGCIISHAALGAAFAGIGPASIVFFALWFLGMCLMGVFAKKLDNADPKANWIEQGTNGIAQICLLIGLILL